MKAGRAESNQADFRQRRCIPCPIWAKWRPIRARHGNNSATREQLQKIARERRDMEKGIFEGLKVLDCASFIAAPAAATVLSDFGADVIKIEPPGSGDPYRNLPNLPGYPVSEHNFAWLLEARNKRSLALDLSKPEGQAVLHRLAAEADVFITNYPPAVRERLGITHAHLAPHNERLIYASFTGYGEKGEEANKPGFDSNAYWARSGLMDLVRADIDTTPARSIAGMGDHPCAMAFYGAIVTALYKRERTGKGSHVSSNLMANGVWAASVLAQAKLCDATFGERRPRERALNAVTNHYKCKDGRWIILSLLSEEKQWPTLTRCLGREDLINDERFATKAGRHQRSIELIKIFDEVFATKTLAEWRKLLDGNGLVFGVVGILDDIPNDKQMLDNGVLVPFENDTMLTISSPIWVDGSEKVQPRRPPGIGEHSDDILRQAGYDEASIAKLRAAGAVA
jgi:crotonobetainyl-CoA:carnitine CoA-transferase CaiB-like acyl-CoA transferase